MPAQLAELVNLEQLNLSNNLIEVLRLFYYLLNYNIEKLNLSKDLPTSISTFPKLKILKLA